MNPEQNLNPDTISKKLMIFNIIAVILIIVVFFLIYTKKPKQQEVSTITPEITTPSPFESVSIKAKAAYVYDVFAGEALYKKNEFAQLPLASITKLMTALTASELLPKDTQVTIQREFLAEEGDSGLLANESWTLKDLLDFSLVVSSNDGMRSIASVAGALNLNTTDYSMGRAEFIKKMNETAEKLNLKQTYFVNESGLDIGLMSGGYGSAQDVSNLLKYILDTKPEILEATKSLSTNIASNSKTHIAKNTNTEIGEIPGVIASKTGFTDMAGGNLAIVFDASLGRPIIVVVLGSDQNARFEDVKTLVDASLKYIQK